MIKLAYSYLRFSTPRQAKGDSYRRQMEAARKYAEEHGLSLQEDAFNDFGISAFKGRNVQSGALGDFLNFVQDGQIPKGAYLLVENHDRLSRTEPEEALHQLQSLVRAGIIVVTLHDGEVYRRGEMDVMRLMKSIIYMERAHNESMIKSQRGSDLWDKRRKDSISSGKVTRASSLPSWLEWKGDSVAVIEGRAEVVRTMFKWYAGGVGYQTIAKRLNEQGVATFKQGKEWRSATIAQILKNRAVLGEFQYHTKNAEGRRVPIGEVIRSYYPPIVNHTEFNTVQSTIRQRDNHPGQFSKGRAHNLFTSLISCGNCGAPMTVATKGRKVNDKPAHTHFICTRASTSGGLCFNLNWNSDVIEGHFKQAFPLFIDYYTRGDVDERAAKAVEEDIAKLDREIELKQEAMQHIMSAIDIGGDIPMLVARLKENENSIVQLGQEIEDIRAEAAPRLQSADTKYDRAERMRVILASLALGSDKDIACKRLDFNADLRQVFKSISLHWCYYLNQGVMTFIDHTDREVLELQFEEGLINGTALILVEKVYDDPEFTRDLLGSDIESDYVDSGFEVRHKAISTFVERNQQARGAAKRRLKAKTSEVIELMVLNQLEGVIAGYRNQR